MKAIGPEPLRTAFRSPWQNGIAEPTKLPPIFMAWAQDDPLVLGEVTRFYNGLIHAEQKPEAHIYSSGGHGFGMRQTGTTSDHWIDEFYWWMEAQGLTKPVAR